MSRPAIECPVGTNWCHEHRDDLCWTRQIQVGATYVEVSNGTFDGQPKLFGLQAVGEGVDFDTMRELADAISALLEEVERDATT